MLLNDGTVWSVGDNSFGQLGDGTFTQRTTFVQVKATATTFFAGATMVATKGNTSYALKSDGTVYSWGDGTVGQLGNGSLTQAVFPLQVPGLSSIASIAAGQYDGFAITTNGFVAAWGANLGGELDTTTISGQQNLPVFIWNNFFSNAAASKVDGSTLNAAIIDSSNGRVYVSGDNTHGQAGNGTFGGSCHVSACTAAVTNVLDVSLGGAHVVVRDSSGSAWTWGANSFGQLGNGSFADANTPQSVQAGVTTIGASAQTTFVVK